MRKYDLEERLIDYAVLIINIVKLLPGRIDGRILGNQLIKSGTSPALNYGEAQSAESRKDFIHKSSVILKELRESHVCLRIIKKSNSIHDTNILEIVILETNELVSIFVTGVNTAKKNMIKQKL